MSEARTQEPNSRFFLGKRSISAVQLRASPLMQFALLALMTAIAFNGALATMLGQWSESSTYHHGFVVIPAAMWLIWRERGGFSPPSPSYFAAATVALLAALALAGRAAGASVVEHFTFIGMLIASFVAVFGVANARRGAFGLMLLFFAAPFGESLKPALQAATAASVGPLLALSGAAIERDGALIRTDAATFEIADACGGLNFLLAASLVAAIFAGAAFRSWRKRLGFMALAAAASVVANVVRAFLVILLATKTRLGMDFARDHAAFGWALYAILLVGLILLGRRLRDDWDLIRPGGDGAMGAPAPISRPAMVAALIIASGGAFAALHPSVFGY